MPYYDLKSYAGRSLSSWQGVCCVANNLHGKLISMKPGRSSLGKFEENSEGGQDFLSCSADYYYYYYYYYYYLSF